MKKDTTSTTSILRMKNLTDSLQSALSTWESLSLETEGKLSPEEEQLREIQRLLGELKSKIQQFDSNV